MRINLKVFIILFFVLSAAEGLQAQNQKREFIKDIFTNDFKITLTNNEVDFFTGSINVTDIRNSKDIFTADSFFTSYVWDTLIDLNGDNNNELVVNLETGGTMYNYNIFLIFDLKNNPAQPFEIQNAELIEGLDEVPKIISYVRLSPAALGAGYTFSLKYENGAMKLEKDITGSKVLKDLAPDEENTLYMINEYKKGFNECAADSEIKTYYEAYIMQQKILRQEELGWKFFDRNYKCRNKKKIKALLRESIDKSYNYLETFKFKFGEERNF